MKKALILLAAVATLASCATSKGSQYQQHLSHKHTGGHYLNTNNPGCGWANN